jgi:hypothetical protein
VEHRGLNAKLLGLSRISELILYWKSPWTWSTSHGLGYGRSMVDSTVMRIEGLLGPVGIALHLTGTHRQWPGRGRGRRRTRLGPHPGAGGGEVADHRREAVPVKSSWWEGAASSGMQGEGWRQLWRGEALLGAAFIGAMGEGYARAIERWRQHH